MDSDKFITDDYWRLINYNYDQIRHAELKASIIISIYSIFTVAYTIDILMMKTFTTLALMIRLFILKYWLFTWDFLLLNLLSLV